MSEHAEQNPLFPSGPWNGFYTYTQGPNADRHPMPSNFTFSQNKISGSGSDDVGTFSWSGTYDTKNPSCQMTKKYATHSISYQGRVDNNGIWGTWTMMGWTGGFHLWPSEAEKGEEEEEALLEELLKELDFSVTATVFFSNRYGATKALRFFALNVALSSRRCGYQTRYKNAPRSFLNSAVIALISCSFPFG